MTRALPVPIATAELVGSFVSRRGDIFTTATICVDFTPCSSAAGDRPAVLLLTLSPLHEVRAVRVLHDETTRWQSLRLDDTTLRAAPYAISRRIVGDASRFAAHLKPTADQTQKEEEEEQEEDESEEDVLVLNLGSSIGEGSDAGEVVDSEDENECRSSVDYHMVLDEFGEGTESDTGEGLPMGRRWLLLTLAPSAFATDAMDTSSVVTRCCIDVALAPEPLARGSYPRVSILDYPMREDAFVLLAGQRCYDYCICPRIAYATDPSADTFLALDLHVTAVTAVPDAGGSQWEAVGIGALPARPRDLLCAFVRAPTATDDAVVETVESHAGMEWRVRHHTAYTHLTPLVSPGGSPPRCGAAGGPGLYFFHCDQALCEELLSLRAAAAAAWGAGGPVPPCEGAAEALAASGESWVVAGGAPSALLGLRRGVLCVRGGAVVAAAALRSAAWRPSPLRGCAQAMKAREAQSQVQLQRRQAVEQLRGRAAVLSGALELRWRALDTPDFDAFPSSAALVRAWALCVLCNARGWTDFLREERAVAAALTRGLSRGESPCIAARYARESAAALTVLSSAHCVASLRPGAARPLPPWRLFTRNSGGLSALLGTAAFTRECGVPLRYVQRVLQITQRHGGDGAVGLLPRAVLHYEERRAKDAMFRDVMLDVKFEREPRGVPPFTRAEEDSEAGIDVSVAVVYFAVRGLPREREPWNEVDKTGARCRVACILPCCWRLRGAALARRVDQHTSFAILTPPCATSKSNGNSNANSSGGTSKGEKNPDVVDSSDEADWGSDDAEWIGNDASKTNRNMDHQNIKNNSYAFDDDGDSDAWSRRRRGISLRVPLLALRDAATPPLFALRVRHTQLWAPPGLFPPAAHALQRAVLQRVMTMALREAEREAQGNAAVEFENDSKSIFTPLLNQLLEDILDTCSATAEERAARLTLFAAAAAGVSSEGSARGDVWDCVWPELRARACREGACAEVNALKRSRSDLTHANDAKGETDGAIATGDGSEASKGSGGDGAVAAAMRGFVHDVVAGDAAYTAYRNRSSGGRRVLMLRRVRPVARADAAPAPAALAAMMARVIAAPLDSNSSNSDCMGGDGGWVRKDSAYGGDGDNNDSSGAGDKERAVLERAKSAALALALPLLPLLHRSGEETVTAAARALLAALRSSSSGADEFVVEAYEAFLHGDVVEQ